jgi:hypothetical protein
MPDQSDEPFAPFSEALAKNLLAMLPMSELANLKKRLTRSLRIFKSKDQGAKLPNLLEIELKLSSVARVIARRSGLQARPSFLLKDIHHLIRQHSSIVLNYQRELANRIWNAPFQEGAIKIPLSLGMSKIYFPTSPHPPAPHNPLKP